MIRLEQALADFQRQVIKSLGCTDLKSTAPGLRAERVKLCLELEVKEVQSPSGKTVASFLVCESRLSPAWPHSNGAPLPAPSASGRHTMEIEFMIPRPESSESPPARNPHQDDLRTGAQSSAQTGTGAKSLVAMLSAVLGAPGFDSSARASTLREVLQGFPVSRTNELVASLKLPPGSAVDSDMERARHFLRGILLSGPAKSIATGSDALEELFTRHSLESILRCLEKEWRGQDNWI